MATETFLSASVIIESPLLQVFDYVANPDHLPEWVPIYSDVEPRFGRPAETGDSFNAQFSIVPRAFAAGLDRTGQGLGSLWLEVSLDDLVHGRRIAYRCKDAG
jgi:uncharacterized protein YndB with AHSA1/START domain